MSANDRTILALLAQGLRDLRSELRSLARLPGPRGERGETGPAGRDGAAGKQGPAGRDGKDGHNGSIGVAGKAGARGESGPAGRDGKDGKDGERGPMGPMPQHEWRGSELRFQQTETRWGEWVQLRGPRGAGGGSTFSGNAPQVVPWNPGSLPLASNAAPSEFIVKQGDQWVRATYEQMQGWFPSGGAVATFRLTTEENDVLITEDGLPIRTE